MRHAARFAVLLASAAMFATALVPAAQAAFGPETFEAGTCINHTCTYASVEANHSEAVTQAASHPAWGITKFTMKPSGSNPDEALRRLRVDVPPGLAADPQAPMPKCSVAQFKSEPKGCPASSEVGTTEMEATLEVVSGVPAALPTLSGTVYNLEPEPGSGLPLDFGIAIEPAGDLVTPVHLFLEGHVDWSGDYHEYFEIHEVPREAGATVLGLTVNRPLKVLMSKLNFNGHAGGNFLTIPSVCSSTTTSHLELESYAGEIAHMETHTPVGVEGCVKSPLRTDGRSPSRNRHVVRSARRRHYDRQGETERRCRRNQHGRHPRCARDAARRLDPQSSSGQWAWGVHRRADRDR